MSDVEGSCYCGAIKIYVAGGLETDPSRVSIICHCSDCQIFAGSLHAYMIAVPTSALEIIRGNPKVFTIAPEATTSGAACHRYFCGDCGTPLYALSEAQPEKTTVKLALFGNAIKPSVEAFWKNAKGWEKPLAPAERVYHTAPL